MSVKYRQRQKKSKYDNFVGKLSQAVNNQSKIKEILSQWDLEIPVIKINQALEELGINLRMEETSKRFFLGHEIININ